MFDFLLTTLLVYKYTLLFAVSFLAALALPLPSSLLLAASGAFAAQGYMNISEVLGVAFLGNVGADVLGYVLAKRYGALLIERVGLGQLLHLRIYHMLETWMRQFPQLLVFTTRFITEIGPAVNILAGLTRIPLRTFLIADFVGEACYVLLFGLTGYFLGDAWQNNTGFLWKGAGVIVSFGVVVAVFQLILRKRQLRIV